jgi:ribosomal protein L6P/L9E
MSRIGKQFIAIPEKVKVKLDGQKNSRRWTKR